MHTIFSGSGTGGRKRTSALAWSASGAVRKCGDTRERVLPEHLTQALQVGVTRSEVHDAVGDGHPEPALAALLEGDDAHR